MVWSALGLLSSAQRCSGWVRRGPVKVASSCCRQEHETGPAGALQNPQPYLPGLHSDLRHSEVISKSICHLTSLHQFCRLNLQA